MIWALVWTSRREENVPRNCDTSKQHFRLHSVLRLGQNLETGWIYVGQIFYDEIRVASDFSWHWILRKFVEADRSDEQSIFWHCSYDCKSVRHGVVLLQVKQIQMIPKSDENPEFITHLQKLDSIINPKIGFMQIHPKLIKTCFCAGPPYFNFFCLVLSGENWSDISWRHAALLQFSVFPGKFNSPDRWSYEWETDLALVLLSQILIGKF